MLAPRHRSGSWLLLGAFALLGLFAMHGLGGHGVHHPTAGDGHLATSASMSTHHGVESGSGFQQDPGAAHACDGSCTTAEAVVTALCLAVLAAAAASALVLGAHRWRLAVVQQPPRPTRLRAILRSARSHDPPLLHALSVQRC